MFLKSAEQLYPEVTRCLSDQNGKKYHNGEWTLQDLDQWKTQTLVNTVKKRYDHNQLAWLTKDELKLLMDWKLAKGKFRPTLPKLILQNDANQVESVTKKAFELLLDSVVDKKPAKIDLDNYTAALKASLKKVTELRGVGPATGSLILSLVSGISDLAPPFFSDEAFIYFVVEPSRSGSKIKYNVKEYLEEYIPVLFGLLLSLGLKMITIEKGAWALKAYDLGKFDILANVDLPFEVSVQESFKYSRYTTAIGESEELENETKGETKVITNSKESKGHDDHRRSEESTKEPIEKPKEAKGKKRLATTKLATKKRRS